MTRTVIFSQDSISTLKTFISTLTHKDIFEFTNVDYSVHIIHYNEKKQYVFQEDTFEQLL